MQINSLKKLASLLLCVALMFTAVPAMLIASADDLPAELVITDCETTTGWVVGGGTGIAINNNGFTGKAIARDISYGANRNLTYNAPTALDISPYQTLKWDMMFHTGAKPTLWPAVVAAYDQNIYVKIGSSASDYNVYRLAKMTVTQDTGNNLWYHFSVNMDDPTSKTGSFDPTKMTIFYFSTIDGAYNSSVPGGHIRFDNIRVTDLRSSGEEGGEGGEIGPSETIVLSDGSDAATRWTYRGSAAAQNTANGNPGACVHAAAGNGALREMVFTPESPVDMSGRTKIEWDMCAFMSKDPYTESFEELKTAYASTMKLTVSDGTKTADIPVSEWEIGELQTGGRWRTFGASLADRGLNLKNIVSFQWVAVPTGTGTNTSIAEMFYRFDNVKALEDTSSSGGEGGETGSSDPVVLSDGSDAKARWTYRGSAAIPNTANGNPDACVHAETGNGALREMRFTPENPVDMSGRTTLEWDMAAFLSASPFTENFDASFKAYRDTINLKVSDGSKTVTIPVSDWQIGEASSTKWRNFAVSLADRGLNLKNIVYFEWCFVATGAAVNSTVENMYYRFDNVKANNNTVTPVGEPVDLVNTYFTDGMMFQQNKAMNIFGATPAANQAVKAELIKGGTVLETKNITSDANRKWSTAFSARAGGYDKYSIKLYLNNTLVQTISDIVIGELWLASGQSNMEYFIGWVIHETSEYEAIYNENVRIFSEPLIGNTNVESSPSDNIVGAYWTKGTSKSNIQYLSAIAYYMCSSLEKELHVPVGYINTAKGSSVIESWLPREVIDGNATVKAKLQARNEYFTETELAAKTNNWKYMTTLYNTRISPIAGINIAGMLWYQGESNIKYAESNGKHSYYEAALSELIDTYSEMFGFDGDMPFIVAHLAPYNNKTNRPSDYSWITASFSESISKVASTADANVMQIPLYDLSLEYKNWMQSTSSHDYDPIHPVDKISVAARFYSAAMNGVYGGTNAKTAPTVSDMSISGKKVVLTFDNVGTGLKSLGSEVKGFAVAGSDRVFVKAKAKITGTNTVEVYSDYVNVPVAVTYAFASFATEANLAGGSNIPAVPYRSDDVTSTYYLWLDWTDFDHLETFDGGTVKDVADYKPTYTFSDGAEGTIVNDTALRLHYTAGEAYVAPALSFTNGAPIANYISNYKGIAITVKNEDARAKQIALQIKTGNNTYYAGTTGGSSHIYYTLPANADHTTFTFDIGSKLWISETQQSGNAAMINSISELKIIVVDSASGSVIISDACVRNDDLSDELPEIKVSGAALTLHNNIAIKFAVNKSVINAYDSAYAIATFDGVDRRIDTYAVNGDYYLFEFRDISPDKMGDMISVKVYGVKDEQETVSGAFEYSVLSYCNAALELYSNNAKLRTMIVDMLNYGAAAQLYTNHNTDNLVNSGLTATQKAWASADVALSNNQSVDSAVSNPSVIWSGASLTLGNSVTMNFQFKTESIDGLTFKITDADGNEIAVVNSNSFIAKGDNKYLIRFRRIHAGQMSDLFFVTAYRGGVAVSNTLQYSVESYAAYISENSSNERLVNLVNAMMKYGKAANIFAR